jgi:hypothetical protein
VGVTRLGEVVGGLDRLVDDVLEVLGALLPLVLRREGVGEVHFPSVKVPQGGEGLVANLGVSEADDV